MEIFLFLLFFASFIYAQVSEPGNPCTNDIQKLLKTGNYADNLTQTLMLDAFGRGYGDLGDYQTCSRISVARYAWAGTNLRSALGLCLPSSCNEDTFPAAIQALAQFWPQLANATFSNMPKIYGDWFLLPETLATLVLISILTSTVLAATMLHIRDLRLKRLLEKTMQHEEFGVEDLQDYSLLDRNNSHKSETDRLLPGTESAWPIKDLSAIASFQRLFTAQKPGEEQLSCLHGLRVLSMMWIILGHTYLFADGILQNGDYVIYFLERRFAFQIVMSATFGAETFFFLSGFLAAMSITKILDAREKDDNDEHGQPKAFECNFHINLLYVYFHRFSRIWPSLVIILLIWHHVVIYMSNGPIWFTFSDSVTHSCDSWWWTNVIFINNFVPTDYRKSCFRWAWYIACDVQLFAIVPFLVWFIYKLRKAGFVLLGFLIACTVAGTGVIVYLYDIKTNDLSQYNDLTPAGIDTSNYSYDYFNYIYDKPYLRATPYLVGIGAFFIFRYFARRSISSSKTAHFSHKQLLVGYLTSFTTVIACIFGAYRAFKDQNQTWSFLENFFYLTFTRLAWSVGVAFLALACIMGWGGVINRFLSAPLMVLLSRLCFGAYLTSPIVISVIYASIDTLFYVREVSMMYFFVTHLIFSFGCALLLYIFVEKPFRNLERRFIIYVTYIWTKSCFYMGTGGKDESHLNSTDYDDDEEKLLSAKRGAKHSHKGGGLSSGQDDPRPANGLHLQEESSAEDISEYESDVYQVADDKAGMQTAQSFMDRNSRAISDNLPISTLARSASREQGEFLPSGSTSGGFHSNSTSRRNSNNPPRRTPPSAHLGSGRHISIPEYRKFDHIPENNYQQAATAAGMLTSSSSGTGIFPASGGLPGFSALEHGTTSSEHHHQHHHHRNHKRTKKKNNWKIQSSPSHTSNSSSRHSTPEKKIGGTSNNSTNSGVTTTMISGGELGGSSSGLGQGGMIGLGGGHSSNRKDTLTSESSMYSPTKSYSSQSDGGGDEPQQLQLPNNNQIENTSSMLEKTPKKKKKKHLNK